MISYQAMEESKSLKNVIDLFLFNRNFSKNNPGYFYPDGFLCFVGSQGSGKTLSAVNYVEKLMLMYSKVILVTNLDLDLFPIDYKNVFPFEKASDLLKYKNGKYGVIFLIDEIHLYFSSMKGNNNINMDVLQQICQQRKQRIHIVATTQVYAQLNVNLRRQFDTVILCEKKLFGYMQKNSLIDRNSIGSKDSNGQTLDGVVRKRFRYFRSPDMFEKYDTYAVIKNPNLSVESEAKDIYETRTTSDT